MIARELIESARTEAMERYSSRLIEDYDGDRYDEDEWGYDATARQAFIDGAQFAFEALEQTPEPLPLDPKPWLCSDRYCTAPGLHRGAKRDALREGRTFEPREGYEQDPARYDKETER